MKATRLSRCIAALLFSFFFFTHHAQAIAAEFSRQPAGEFGPVSVLVRGDIRDGDFDRFRDFLLLAGNLKAFASYVWLDSPGGNLNEALKFASLFEQSRASVVVGPDAKCYSACFIMFAGGVDRVLYPFGELGVHQISTDQAGIEPAVRERLLAIASNNLYAWLVLQGIPQALVDRMKETPASGMYVMDALMFKRNDWNRAIATDTRFLAEVQQACGPHPFPEKSLIDQQRDENTRRLMKPWTACRIAFQIAATRQFADSELKNLESGKPSLLFADGKLEQAARAVSALH